MKKIISILFIAFLSLFLTTFVVGVKAEDNKSVEASSTPNISSATIDGVEGEIAALEPFVFPEVPDVADVREKRPFQFPDDRVAVFDVRFQLEVARLAGNQ